MTRRFCTFAAALITIVTSLVAFTWAQAPAGGFEQFWGARYSYPSSSVAPSSAAPAGGVAPAGDVAALAARRPNPSPDPGASNAMHHWNHIAIDSAGLDHTPVAGRRSADLWRANWTRAIEPRHGHRPHRDVRRGQCDRQAIPKLHQHSRRITRMPRFPRPSDRPPTTRWWRCTPRRSTHCDEVLAVELAKIPEGRAKAEGIRVGQRAARAILELRSNDGSQHKEAVTGHRFHHERSARKVAPGSN